MTSIRRLTSLVAVLAMLLTMTAVPAFAVAMGTATITTGDLLSGEGGNVNVRISNAASAGVLGVGSGSAIDALVIEVPDQIVDVAAGDVTLPTGWNGGYDAEIGFIFAEAGDGAELAPGQAFDVAIGVTADRVADDTTGRFVTSVSDNGGRTLSPAGAPEVTTRILGILDATLVKPAEATNTDLTQVTAQQDTARFDVVVRNYGTQTRSVTADVAKTAQNGGSSTLTTDPAAASVASGQSATLAVPTTFGNAGSLSLEALATSTSSEAAPSGIGGITVQEAFAANYVADSLVPTTVAQNSTVDFEYRVNKTAGAQPVTGDASFAFGGFSTSAPQDLDAANGQKTILFPQVTVPNLANGTYDTTSTITGFDGNGATVSVTLQPGGLTLDNLIPVVSITVDVGEPDVEGASPATTDGRQIRFSGSIGLSSGPSETCDNCTVTKAVLKAFPSGTEFPVNLNNAGGTLSGTGSFDFPDGTSSARAIVTAERPSGADGTGQSNTVTVDLIAPSLIEPARTFRAPQADQIIVTIDEIVDASVSTGLDWSVDGNAVTDVSPAPSPAGATSVTLTLANRIDDNATPVVAYAPRSVFGTRMHDRVSIELADQVIDTVDGIIPEAPVIDTVNGLGLQDGEFWINDSTPEVGLSDLVVGNTLEIFYDTDGDGTAESGERVFIGPVNSTEQTVTLANLGNTEVSFDLIARMVDGPGNIGLAADEVLNLDFTAATIIDIEADGQNVTVFFDEPIARGRDAAFDWTVSATQDGRTANRTVLSVTEGADATQRVLEVSTDSFDSTAGDAQVLGVRYKYRGVSDRYEDRATNAFLDVVYTD